MSDCTVCGATDNLIDHHINYEPGEVIPVCLSCHWKIHNEDDFHPDLTPDHVPEDRQWNSTGKSVDVDKRVHKRLSRYGRLGETYSRAINRALDEAGAPELDELDDTA